ncbi:MAG: T9SS type A sorting domain-containing protein [Candidatus Aegiribacteria sp.]|nr:T9SS type A sorting domain-containing protein [Candidatus Aegiribacteria sp.]
MKMTIVVLFLLSILVWASSIRFEILSESASELIINTYLESYSQAIITDDEGRQYTYLDVDNAIYTYLDAFPSYPYICKFILSPNGSDVSLDLNTITWTFENIVELALAEDIYDEYENMIDFKEEPFWSSGVFLGTTENCGSFNLTPIFVFPFQYNQSTKELYSMSECNFTININPISNFTIESRFKWGLRPLCFNYSSIEEYINEVDSDPGDYLIIYSHEDLGGKPQAPPANLTDYKDALQPLMDYRESLGYTIRWAYISPSEATSAVIKNVIDYYVNYCDIRNIILLGEHERIPSHVIGSIYSDNWYIDEYGYEAPIIGRFPGNPDQIEIAVTKILEYEEYFSSVYRGMLCNDVILMAQEGGGFREHCEVIASNEEYTADLDFIKYYREDGPIDGNEIISTINSGVGIVAYSGHGLYGHYCWDVPAFESRAEIGSLGNNYYPVVFNTTCSTGEYWSGECLSEAWLHDSDGGASGVYAASGITYINCNKLLLTTIFTVIFTDDPPEIPPPVALCAYYALRWMRWMSPHANEASITFDRYIWFGDPGQRLWTQESAGSRIYDNEPIYNTECHISDHVWLSNIESISVGPNPSYSNVSIVVSANESSPIDISVYDIAGRKIDTIHTGEVSEGNNSFTWDNESFAQGLYMIRLTDNTGASKVERVMIIR